ncbi:MAG TPA: HEAT repeat domain-containing protein [Candidatus Limnocylindrales bacterium]|nr:HEAT repeat domain-containing protein [Candidatus Limnocylindrales bacterium]
MLWLTLRQLKSGGANARRKAAREIWRDPTPRGLSALATAVMTDSDSEVRQIAASALGRSNDPARYDHLLKALNDRHPDVIRSAMMGLRRASDERVIPALVPLLRHPDFTVRTSAGQTIDTIPWVPKERDERVSFYVAKGWFDRAAAAGVDAIPVLQLTAETGPVFAAVRAVEALGKIGDPSVVKFLRTSLRSAEPAVAIAAADGLGKVGGQEAVEGLKSCLTSSMTQLRAAAVQALGRLGAAEATGMICKMLLDKEWEVRREAASALGKLNNPEGLEPLTKALEDIDSDVRDAAALALGKMGDRRGVGPLVLALKDEVSSVRRIAAASLSRIDPDWVSLPETRSAAEQLKIAIQDAEPAVRFFVAQLLVNLGELSPDAIAGLAPEDHLASPAIKRRRMATNLFIAMLEDRDRDVRQAAAEALGHLGGDRAQQALARAGNDPDGDVAAATQMALQALGTPSDN